jgi:hypothetical protein
MWIPISAAGLDQVGSGPFLPDPDLGIFLSNPGPDPALKSFFVAHNIKILYFVAHNIKILYKRAP